MPKNILILDDDAQRRALHAFGLCCAGFQSTQVAGLDTALNDASRHRPDLVLLFADRLDGQTQALTRTLMGALQASRPRVVAMLSAGTPAERAMGLELGLLDCLAGPFRPLSLVDSVRAWLDEGQPALLLPCGLEVDLQNGVLSRSGLSVTLGPTERRLMAALFEHPERGLSRSYLTRRVFGERDGDASRLVDVSVCKLRRSLRQLDRAYLLQTIRGIGYRIMPRKSQMRTSNTGDRDTATDPLAR